MADGTRTVRIKFDGSTSGLDAAAVKGRADLEAMSKGLDKFQADATAASRQVQAAQDSVANATGKLRVAELQLQELQASGLGKDSQLAAAEEKVAAARRNVTAATTKLEDESSKLAAAQTQVATSHRAISEASEKLKADIESATGETDKHEKSWEKLTSWVDKGAKSLGTGALSFLKFGVAGPVAVGAVGALAATMVQLSGVLGLLPGAAAAGIATMLALKLGGDGAKKAFDKLTPTLDTLKTKVSASLETALLPAVTNLKGLLPQLTGGLQEVAGAAGGFATKITAALKKPDTANDLKDILTQTAGLLRNMSGVASPFIDALVRIGRIGLDALVPLTSNLGGLAQKFDDFVRSASGAQKIKDWISGGVEKFGDLGDALKLILGHLDDLWHIAQPIFSALEPLIKPVVDVLIQVAQAVGQALGPAVEAAAPFIKDIASQLGQALVQALQQLTPMLPGLVQALGSLLLAITPLITQIGIPTLVALIRSFITGLIALTPAILIVLGALTPLIGAFAAFLLMQTGNGPAAMQVMQNSLTASGQIMRVATDTDWGAMLQSVNQNLSGMTSSAKSGGNSIATGITDGANLAKNGVGSAFGGMLGITQGGVGSVVSTVFGGQKGMSDGGSAMGSAMSGALQGLDWSGIGSRVVEGVLKGVLGFPGALIRSAASSIAGKFAAEFKAAFGIQSPSKLMADEVGRWIPAGIGQGVLKYESTVIGPVAALRKDITTTANVRYLTGDRGPNFVTDATPASAPAAAGGGTQSIALTLDLGAGIQQRMAIEIDRQNRATVRALTAGAGANR